MFSGIETKQKCRSAYYLVYMCSTYGTYSNLGKFTESLLRTGKEGFFLLFFL